MPVFLTKNLTPEEYLALRAAAGWRDVGMGKAVRILKRADLLVCARTGEGKPAGMARLYSDGGCHFVIDDVIVLPEYRRQGIAQRMVETLIAHVQTSLAEKETAMILLFSSPGKEPFYQRLGFLPRPGPGVGAGMYQWLTRDTRGIAE